MNPLTPLQILIRLLLAGLILLNLGAKSLGDTYTVGSVTYTRDEVPREFTPRYLANRLGVAQKASTLGGIAVKDRNGSHKFGTLRDVVVDWSTGKVLCALVEVNSKVVAVPGRSFFSTDNKDALLEAKTADLNGAPRAESDLPKLVSSLGASYEYFGQKAFWDPATAPAQARKCSELLGLQVRNKAGESLGQVVNLMVDLPTARVVFAVVSFAGASSDLYVAPPTAFEKNGDGFVANVEKAKVAELAHSDDFFWSNMADEHWGITAYRAFGRRADFDTDAPAAPAQDAARENVREKIEAPAVAVAPAKSDRELAQDILTAMMRDNVDNPFIYNKVKIQPANGQVTLNGRVKNEQQKAKLLSIVASVVGATNVRDQVTVK